MSELENLFNSSLNSSSDANLIDEFANTLIHDSKNRDASHIHIQRFAKRADVRYRVAGKLLSVGTLTTDVADKLLLRFKKLANIDLAERKREQDGRIQVTRDDSLWPLHCSFMPSFKGWTLLLTWQPESQRNSRQLSELGMTAAQQEKAMEWVSHDRGILLVSGNRGTYGAPTVARSLLLEASRIGKIAVSLEYGLGRPLAGVTQCDMRSNRSMTERDWFDAAIRQQPDVLFVEAPYFDFFDKSFLRVAEHCLIIATMLRPIEILACVIASSIRQTFAEMMLGGIQQRLHRRICQQCKLLYQPQLSELNALGLKCSDPSRLRFAKNAGCSSCRRNKWWWDDGKIGTHELVSVTGEVQELFSQDAPRQELRESILKSEFTTHYQSAVSKVIQQEMASATVVANFQKEIESSQLLDIATLSVGPGEPDSP